MYSQWLIGSLCNVVSQIFVVCRQIGSVDRAEWWLWLWLYVCLALCLAGAAGKPRAKEV